MRTVLRTVLALLVGLGFLASSRYSVAQPLATDDVAISAAVDAFHKALAQGDPDRATSLLLPDALIVEAGTVQTRDQYQREHLSEDISFARAVPAIKRTRIVRREGDAAWVTSTYRVTGSFQSQAIDNFVAETAVLTKTTNGWRIRTIHWSTHKVKK